MAFLASEKARITVYTIDSITTDRMLPRFDYFVIFNAIIILLHVES